MSIRGRYTVIALVAVALFISCVIFPALAARYFPPRVLFGDPSRGTFTGYYSSSFDVSSFVNCDHLSEQWWLTVDSGVNFTEHYNALATQVNPPTSGQVTVYTRFRGQLSPSGSYGHLGAYTRHVTVTEVLEMSLEDNC